MQHHTFLRLWTSTCWPESGHPQSHTRDNVETKYFLLRINTIKFLYIFFGRWNQTRKWDKNSTYPIVYGVNRWHLSDKLCDGCRPRWRRLGSSSVGNRKRVLKLRNANPAGQPDLMDVQSDRRNRGSRSSSRMETRSTVDSKRQATFLIYFLFVLFCLVATHRETDKSTFPIGKQSGRNALSFFFFFSFVSFVLRVYK